MVKYGRRKGPDKTMTLRDWLPFVSSTGDNAPASAEPATGLSPIPSSVSQVVANKWPADFTHDDLRYTLNTVQDYAIRAYGPTAYPDGATDDQGEQSADQTDHPVVELVNRPKRRSDLEEQFHADEDGVDGFIVTAERWDAIQDELEMSDLALRAVQEAHAAYAIELEYNDYGSLLHPLFIATDNPPALEGEVAETAADQSTEQEDEEGEQDEEKVMTELPADSSEDTSTETADTSGDGEPIGDAGAEAEIETEADAGDSEAASDGEVKGDTDTETEAETTDPAAASQFVFDESIESGEPGAEAGLGESEADDTSTEQDRNTTTVVDDTSSPETGAPADGQDVDETASGPSDGGSQPPSHAPSTDEGGTSGGQAPVSSRTKSSDGGAIDATVGQQADATERTESQADGDKHTAYTDVEWPAWMLSAVEPQYSARNE